MAVLVRCFCLPSHPKTFDICRQRTALSGKFSVQGHDSDVVALLPFFGQQVAVVYSMTSMKFQVPSPYPKKRFQFPCDTGNILSSKPSIFMEPEICQIIMDHISNHQRSKWFTLPKMCVAANVLTLVLPIKALAETCQTENSAFNMPLLFAIALIGAAVGGNLARQRRGELTRLNDQLRQINAALRRQAKIESYAPNLSYAPVGRIPETEIITDPKKQELIATLRTGKNYLRNHDPEKAFVEFKTAYELAQSLGDHIEVKKAARGLGASLQKLGKYKEAIKYHSKVLEIAKQSGEDSGGTEAYGAIADCYTELGDLEQAGKFYDKYIARLQTE